jgi:Amt family ammonium transporter
MLIWVTYGYSLAFTNGGGMNAYVGGLSKAFLNIAPEGKTIADATAATFSNGYYVPELVYIAFQMTFACITCCLIVGAFAERMKFSALLLFSALWVTFIYLPIAHMVWYWAGPDAIAEAAKAVVEAGSDAAKKAAAEAKLAAVKEDAGLIFQWGALDFAGGTVVHINSGIAGLVGCLLIGKRIGYGKELMAPHSLTMTMIGAALLWVGWFGFNAGSNLEANGVAALAMMNTFVAAAAAGLSWLLIEWAAKGKPSLLGLASGVVAGLVAVTPASGFAGPMGSIVLGLVAGGVCFAFCSTVKNSFGYDDALDVFGIHAVGGILGALATGILVNTALGGTGVPDYESKPGELAVGAYALGTQLWAQMKGVLLTIAWSGIGSFIIYKIVDVVVGLRVTQEQEREGLDIAEHGERAYNY